LAEFSGTLPNMPRRLKHAELLRPYLVAEKCSEYQWPVAFRACFRPEYPPSRSCNLVFRLTATEGRQTDGAEAIGPDNSELPVHIRVQKSITSTIGTRQMAIK